MPRTVLCFDGTKAAALYFDRVLLIGLDERNEGGYYLGDEEIPYGALICLAINLKYEQKWGMHSIGHSARDQYFNAVIWKGLQLSKALRDIRRMVEPNSTHSSPKAPDFLQPKTIAGAYLRNQDINGVGPVKQFIGDYTSAVGVSRTSLLLPPMLDAVSGGTEDPIVTLADLKLIDTSKATWEQILEFRNDIKARAKLQRLRSFLDSSYSGKSPAYIEDDISKRIEDYKLASSKHGFDFVVSSISALVDAKAMQATAVAGICAAFLGGPAAGLTAAAVVELAHFALHIAKRHRDVVDWSKTHDLAYIIEAKQFLGVENS